MASTREMRMRIRSVNSISKVTHALEIVSASKVRKAILALSATRPYATKAWRVLNHLALQPGRANLHPLLAPRSEISNILVVCITSDRGLAGAYNTNILRKINERFNNYKVPVRYLAIGRKGRDLLLRRRKQIIAEFTNLPAFPSFTDISPIGRVILDEFLNGAVDEVYLVFTSFINMVRQTPIVKKVLPLGVSHEDRQVEEYGHQQTKSTYIYEPSEEELLNEIVPRFTTLQVYQAILESLASEHAARMVAMQNATENAQELVNVLTLDYNNLRQKNITSELIDLVSGVEALTEKTI